MNQLINISEAASLAFHGLALVAQESPKRVNVKEIARRLNASEAHLAKVFQTLNRAGITASQRGPRGGFILKRPSEDISFLDVYETIESPVTLSDCPMGYTACGFNDCIFDQKLNDISREILKTFGSIKLDQFIKSGEKTPKEIL
ncbi:Rrf2 family transcriptional regulator [Oceanispirochaeta crateris]|uniref:Rrf2 family transcriptional regulator n=1 Tax=Oceanispirochaeta crateris TaxID=2518645 RepID=A0A5C1QKV8_9SPIO|nr:Rrf2 family transcriptional regulator [Oceanispirochaeta crateris]QEN08795.1 Rrf2 family transcriptional regulator [Oceanispirochaeta crateris]